MLGKHSFKSMVLGGWLTAALGIGMANAQDFYHDNFDDGDVTDATDGGVWNFRPYGSIDSTMDASSGNLVFTANNKFVDGYLSSFDGVPIERRTEWSFRVRVTVHSGPFAGVGTTVFNHAALTPGGLRVGTRSDNVTTPIPYPYYEEELLLQLDAFDSILTGSVWKENDPTSLVKNTRSYNPTLTLPNFGVGLDGQGGPANVTFYEAWVSTTPIPIIFEIGDFNANGVLDVADIDDLTVQSASGMNPSSYDLNSDSLVDAGDIHVWAKDLFDTWIGDANLDREFNSSDLVAVLASGTFDRDVNSVWSTGDFNGDGRTNTSDLIVALADGGFDQGPRDGVNAVPEPTSLTMMIAGLIGLATVSRTRRKAI